MQVLTRDIAYAAAIDAANASMRKAGRKAWSREDYYVSGQTFDRLWPVERDMECAVEVHKPAAP